MTVTAPADGSVSTEPTTAPAVSIRGLGKRFGRGPLILDGIDLEASQGEFVCVLGASGCGKSTLLSLLAGLEQPTVGELHVAGGTPALMFQEAALYPWLTAGQNVELALKLRGAPKAGRAAEVDRLLRVVRLGDVADSRPHQLSGGMRQRVAMARALAQDARVLLMDEPFAALDAITRDALHDELVRVWEETGLTVVFVTHNVREAVKLAQTVLLLSSRPGRVLRRWDIDIEGPRRIEDHAVSALSLEITESLREEIARHAR
jgi:NitT/TauT family transport system ATP-binding protein